MSAAVKRLVILSPPQPRNLIFHDAKIRFLCEISKKIAENREKKPLFFAQHKDTETQRITEGKGTPLLRKEGLGVVDFPRELIWSLRLKLFLKLYLELFCTRILNYHF